MNEATATRERLRRDVLKRMGAVGAEVEELLDYGRSRFADANALPPLPLDDEPFVAVWREYAAEAAHLGVWRVLREKLIQLRFPIRAGISTEPIYRAATLQGKLPETAQASWTPVDPTGLKLILHETAAGAIPVLQTRNREDFVGLVRILTLRNEPVPIPDSMGATMVAGFSNWDRIARYRRNWEEITRKRGGGNGEWPAEFARLIPCKHLYQDRFILLSEGDYSNVSADKVGMTEEEWRQVSLRIRLEHECAHYFTRRVFGSMQNAVHDEFLADYAGIVGAIGHYQFDWFMLFMGMEDFPCYRQGGRLENYQTIPPPGARVFTLLQRLIRKAAENLARWDNRVRASGPGNFPGQTALLAALAGLHLEELASEEADSLLARAVKKTATHV